MLVFQITQLSLHLYGDSLQGILFVAELGLKFIDGLVILSDGRVKIVYDFFGLTIVELIFAVIDYLRICQDFTLKDLALFSSDEGLQLLILGLIK